MTTAATEKSLHSAGGQTAGMKAFKGKRVKHSKMAEFTEGQKVIVADHYGVVAAVSTVTKMGKLKMTLADGTEWKVNGHRRWGATSTWYTGPTVRAWRDGDDEKLQHTKNHTAVLNFHNWHALTNQQLATVAAVCREYYRTIEEDARSAK